MSKNVVIVGGGLAGLAASIYLARAGRTVTVFEKRRYLGGRAITQLRHGYRFNLGAHAFYRTGAAAAVCKELGVPVPGVAPKPKAIALIGGEERGLPSRILSLLTTSLLSIGGKMQLASALWRIRSLDFASVSSQTLREWLDSNISDTRARQVLESLIRLATYSDHAETESAALPLAQMKLALRGVLYVHEGWQRIIDSMHSTAISSGVNFVTSSRIVGVDTEEGRVRAVRLGGLELDADRTDTMSIAYPEMSPEQVDGARLPADTVILAVDPTTAAELAGEAGASWASARPVTAACLDVALRTLPNPKRIFALGIDEPLYFAAHSAWAQLAPKGGALIHTVKYRKEQSATDVEIEGERARRDATAAADERTLEALLDRMQPGWRDVLVHRRFLPAMTVSNALVTPSTPRPSAVTNVRGLFIAGDWVGDEGLLSDAALSSARAAAKGVLSS
ncbi:MAG TPA: FAD-dependent oxidoreductase [Thermoanaerobaculia bacterium]|nr:FAD-dependent oxidoreductase [Thermoanaerobaculia bacterium]